MSNRSDRFFFSSPKQQPKNKPVINPIEPISESLYPPLPDSREAIEWLDFFQSMLSYQRPGFSASEQEWIKGFLTDQIYLVLEQHPERFTAFEFDGYNNLAVTILKPDGTEAETLFSAHTDTVHSEKNSLMSGQQQVIKSELGYFYKIDGQPLGADDATGCLILLELIKALVPGTYVFHRMEERGGKGSSWIAENRSEWLGKFKRAIAFDRKATNSIITYQNTGKCCSNDFAEALSEQLNGLLPFDPVLISDTNSASSNYLKQVCWTPDDTGVFTDTANYVDVIPECTNLSCGYYKEHTGNERQDFRFLYWFISALKQIDWESLPVVRQPGDDGYTATLSGDFSADPFAADFLSSAWGYEDYYRQSSTSRSKTSTKYKYFWNEYEAELKQVPAKGHKKRNPIMGDYLPTREGQPLTELIQFVEDWSDYDQVLDFVLDCPDEAADLLHQILRDSTTDP